MKPLPLDHIRQQITALLLECPELKDDDVLRADMIEGNTDAFAFLSELERRRREACIQLAGLEQTITDLEKRSERFIHRNEVIKKLMRTVLDAADLKKIELPEATISVRASAPKVILVSTADLPDYYWRVHREPNKTLIGAALKAGTQVPGAMLSNAEPHIAISTK
jgi:hypothetical protein